MKLSCVLRPVTFAFAFLLSAGLLSSPPARADTVVATDAGPVRGVAADGVTRYLGLPYAAPPVGALRWRPPQPPSPWQPVRVADAFGNRCPQTTVVGEFSSPSTTEDCLFINVFVPTASAPGDRLAVMVWIPGGGFFGGGSNDYDMTSLVTEGNVIVVSLNYRLGVLGSLAQPDIDAEGHASADYGLLDQQLALQWVRTNVAAFGGDPENVTLFGESAGAISIYGHMVSPGSKGLFHKAILESGFTDYPAGPLTNPRSVLTSKPDADRYGRGFAAAMGCTDDVAACLRRLPVEQVIDRQMPFVSGLIFGVPAVPGPFDALLRQGRFNQVPIINGTNHDEWRWPMARTELRTGRPMTADQYPGETAKFFGDIGPRIAAEYRPGTFGSPSEALAAAQTDAVFSCGALRNDHWLAQYVPVYGYEFNDAKAPMYMPPASFPYGAAHTQELQFLFPLFHGGSGAPHKLTPEESGLSTTMVRYWTNFAKSGDPNGSGLPAWPKLTPTASRLQSLTLPEVLTIDSFGDDHRCAFWSALVP